MPEAPLQDSGAKEGLRGTPDLDRALFLYGGCFNHTSDGSDNADGTHAMFTAAQIVVCRNLIMCMQCDCHGLQHIPSKKPLKQKVLGPNNAMNGLVRRVADGAYRVRLGCLLGLALKTFSLAS